jgi:ATP-dependent Lon protease
MPDNNVTVIFQGLVRCELKQIVQDAPYIKAEVELAREERPEKDDKNFQVLADTCKEYAITLLKLSELKDEATFAFGIFRMQGFY